MKNDKPSDIKKFLKSSKFSNINFFLERVKKCRVGGITKHPRGCSGELNTP